MTELEARIEKIVAGGDGLARHEGRVVFVPGSAPGERHRVSIEAEKKDYARARSLEILEPSPRRRPPPCPYYRSCGGCSLMHLDPDGQLEARKGILEEGLERVLKSPYRGPLTVHSGEELHYRNRLRFHVAFAQGRPIAGFRRYRSREIVDIDRCLLGTASLNEAWGRIRRILSVRPPLARSVVSVELEESTHEPGRIAARFLVSSTHGLRSFPSGPSGEEAEGLLRELGLEGLVAAVSTDFGGGPGLCFGRPFVEHRVSGFPLRQSVGSFFQSNRFLLQELVEAVVGDAGPAEARGLDLFSGVGLFTLPLARKLSSVVGVESESLALRDARENASRAAGDGGPRVRFLRSDATSYLSRAKLAPEDFVIVDPPRGGLSRELSEGIGRGPLRRLRYVSCDPAALFRDASRLSLHGFALERVALFDLFPNTHHFETVASFARRR